MPFVLVLAIGAALAAAVTVVWPLIGQVAERTAVLPQPTKVEYIVVPHPDDEFQAWSLIEADPMTYKVFILATRGEATGFCEPSTLITAGLQDQKEPAPEPIPQGRWTASCAEARLHSWLNFFADQARTDPTLPSELEFVGTRGPFPDRQPPVCRIDRTDECAGDRTAEVWVDKQGRGALVAFNLGDGDLTSYEVAWAVRTVKQKRQALGIDTSLPNGALIGGSFANENYDCFSYPHPDHLAVHEALYDIDFNMDFQAAPTCADDPDAARSEVVSDKSAAAAFKVGPRGQRLGSHVSNYGWLFNPYYPLDREGQDELFHTHQEFWVRFQHSAGIAAHDHGRR